MKKFALIAIAATLSHNAIADEKKEERNWHANAEVGFNVTSGNSDTQSMKLRFDLKQSLESWDTNYILDALRKEDNDEESANKWLLSAKGNYKLEDQTAYFTVGASREEDRFGVFDNYNKVTAGYGKLLHKSESLEITADIGPGYAFYEYQDTEETDNSAIINLAGQLNWKVSESSDFSQKIIIEQGLSDEKNTKTRLESALSSSINGSLKMKLGLTILNNSETQPGRKKTDTETSVTLVYAF